MRLDKVMLWLVFLTSPVHAQELAQQSEAVDWSKAGEWSVPYVVDAPSFTEDCRIATTCISFEARVVVHVPWCFRYLDPKVIHDGREIPGHVVEVGTPGEPDWEWKFQTDEIFTGPFTWNVKTVDVCQKAD